MSQATARIRDALADFVATNVRLRRAAPRSLRGLDVAQQNREDNNAIAAVVIERKRHLAEDDLVTFDDMAVRVGVDVDDLP